MLEDKINFLVEKYMPLRKLTNEEEISMQRWDKLYKFKKEEIKIMYHQENKNLRNIVVT